jgi:hypothetical protein
MAIVEHRSGNSGFGTDHQTKSLGHFAGAQHLVRFDKFSSFFRATERRQTPNKAERSRGK